ncbi:MAG: lipoate--protein ligase [Bacillota bacterium]
MYLYRLGKLSGQQSMIIFHALARMGQEGVILVSPARPIVSIGYFQDTRKVADLDYCRAHGISVMRREIGGGTTFLDENQIFFQLVMRRDNPAFPRKIAALYELVAGPCVDTYRDLGVDAAFRPVNDVITRDGRKVSGLGGADIGECMVFVGNIILDFDYRSMASILKVPSEKFRDKVHKSLEENLTTTLRETGKIPPRREVEDLLAKHFAARVGPLEEVPLGAEVLKAARELEKEFMRDEFLFKKGKAREDYVKIAEGVSVLEQNYKAPGGLITVTCAVSNGAIRDISLSGDFTFYPREMLGSLEEALAGVRREAAEVEQAIGRFYQNFGIDSPGVTPADFATAICAG